MASSVDAASAWIPGNFFWLDMESSPYVDGTIKLYARLRALSPNVGVAIQSYLFRTEADLCPDANSAVLTVHVHSMANPRSNRAIHHLLTQLNAAELTYPGTNFKLVYTLARGPDH